MGPNTAVRSGDGDNHNASLSECSVIVTMTSETNSVFYQPQMSFRNITCKCAVGLAGKRNPNNGSYYYCSSDPCSGEDLRERASQMHWLESPYMYQNVGAGESVRLECEASYTSPQIRMQAICAGGEWEDISHRKQR